MSSPVPLKAAVYLYHKGTQENWLTSRVSNGMLSTAKTKPEASKWVIEKQGLYYTIRLMNTSKYLAAKSVTATGDCTAVLMGTPSGTSHLWNISKSGTGIRIGTVAACRERGVNVKQFLKIANVGGSHLELASKDSDVFYVVLANATTARPVTVRPGGTPTPVGTVGMRMQPVTEIPKIVTIEPYLRPRYYLAPSVIPTGVGKEGSVTMSVSRSFWYTQPTQNTISFLTSPTGAHVSVDRTCSSPILYNGVLTTRGRFYVASVRGAQGYVLKTEKNACGDGRARYLVTHTNGRPGVSKNPPTQKTLQQYLWRFTVGSVTAPPETVPSTSVPTDAPTSPIQTQPSIPIPPPTTLPTFIPDTRRPVDPTLSPTFAPTLPPEEPALPTFGPTFAPTNAPTTIPTFEPIPTLTPTGSPTDSPTFMPTDSPTFMPTDSPTGSPTFMPSESPTSSGGPGGMFPGSININIEDRGKWGNDRVVFPYPVAPDLLLASNPDGSLVLQEPTATAETTVSPSTGEPENPDDIEEGDGDVLIPEFEGDDGGADGEGSADGEGGDGGEGRRGEEVWEDEPFWTMPRIALALIAFIVIAIIAYFVYTSYASSNGSGNKGNGSTTPNATGTNATGTNVTGTNATRTNVTGTNATGTNATGTNATGTSTTATNTGRGGNTNTTRGTNGVLNALNGLAPPANNLGNLGDFGAGDNGTMDTFGDGFNDFANVNDIGPPPPTGR